MESQLDLNSMQFYVYAAIGAGVLVVLAVIISLLPIGKLKVPAILLSSVGCLVVGFALGVLTLALFGYHWDKHPGFGPIGGTNPYAAMQPGPMSGMGGPGAGGGDAPARPGPGGAGGAFGGGGPGGGRGPNPKAQLANLVAKLETLTRTPLQIELSAEQRAKVVEQLEGLAEANPLSTEDAQTRLDALLLIVKDDHATLEAAGFRVPGFAGAPPLLAQPPNPFFEPDKGKALKNLKERLAATKLPG